MKIREVLSNALRAPEDQTWLERVAGMPIMSSVILMATLFIGVYVNRYTREIMDAANLLRPHYTSAPYARHAVFFFLLVALVSLLTLEAQRAVLRERNAADKRRTEAERNLLTASQRLEKREEELQHETKRVKHMLRTLPPSGFLDRFDALHLEAHDALVRVLYNLGAENPTSADELRGEIRLVLSSIASLIRAFDPTMQAATFYANVAWYRQTEWIAHAPPAVQAYINKGLTQVGHKEGFSTLRGVLVLDSQLSTVTPSSGGGGRDEHLAPLVFPVPCTATATVDGVEKSTVLPGAPLAWSKRELVSYPNQAALLEWCEKHGAFAPSVVPALRSYLADGGKEVQSFASIPILRYDQPTMHPHAILNVHCNRPGLLEHRRPDRHLLPLITPLVASLKELLDPLDRIQAAEAEATADLAGGAGQGGSPIPGGAPELVGTSNAESALPPARGTSLDGDLLGDADS